MNTLSDFFMILFFSLPFLAMVAIGYVEYKNSRAPKFIGPKEYSRAVSALRQARMQAGN